MSSRLEKMSAVLNIIPSVRKSREAKERDALWASYQESLQRGIEAVRAEATAATVTNYWRAKLQLDGFRIGYDFHVPDCDWTEEEIRSPIVDIQGRSIPGLMVYKPDELIGVRGLIHLDKMYPGYQNNAFRSVVRSGSSKDADMLNADDCGWIKVEATVKSPNLGTSWQELDRHAGKNSYLRQRPSTYILSSKASIDLLGASFDRSADTGTRLHGGFLGCSGMVIDSNHKGRNYEDANWQWYMTTQDGRDGSLGGRFEVHKQKHRT